MPIFNSIFNGLSNTFSGLFNLDSRKVNNAVIVPPSHIYTGEFPKIVPKEIFYEKYHSWPQIKSAVNSTVKKIMGAEVDVSSEDEKFTEMLREWCRIVSFKKTLSLALTDEQITGDFFLELQFTEKDMPVPGQEPRPHLANIKQIPTKTFFKIHRNLHGNELKFVQNVDGVLNELDPEYIVHHTINNPDNEAFGKSEFYSVAAPRPLVSKVDQTTGEAINPDRFVAPILDMQARNLHAEMEYKEKMAKGRIIVTARNMPQKQQDQLKKELNDPSSEKTFWVFGDKISPEDISVQEASISSQSKLDRYTDNMNREVDLATQVASKIATDPGGFSFASSQTPMQELAERISEMQAEVNEVITERVFRLLAEQWGFDFDDVQPKLVFKPFLKKVDLEELNKIDPTRISDSEYRDAIRDIITLDDKEFEREKDEKRELVEQQNNQQPKQPSQGNGTDERQPEEIEKIRPSTEASGLASIFKNPRILDNYVKELVAKELAVTGTGADGTITQRNRLFAATKLKTEPPAITEPDVIDKLGLEDEKDDEDEEITVNGVKKGNSKERAKSKEKKSYETSGTTYGGFATLDECIKANTGVEEDPEGYCKSHKEEEK